MESFLTVKAPCEGEFTEQRSRFLSYLSPAASREEALAFLEGVRAAHPQATHCCWAYRVGAPDSPEFYFSDDGEPSGTAGQPILQALQHEELQNAVLAVVRYFGGIKLGVRGLIEAYRQGAVLALERAEKITRRAMAEVPFQCPYAAYDTLRYKIEKLEGEIREPAFAADVRGSILIPRINLPAALALLDNLNR